MYDVWENETPDEEAKKGRVNNSKTRIGLSKTCYQKQQLQMIKEE